MPRFRQTTDDPKQMWLMPPSLDEMLPADSDARALGDALERLDWSVFEKAYFSRGRPPYPPKALASVLIYAYSKGIRSSRKIEELVECDIRFMWLGGGHRPDFHTICRFRKDKRDEFALLFAQSVRLCQEAGLVLLESVSVDGTKIQANASRKVLYDERRLSRELEEVEKILREADDVDQSEDEEHGSSNGRELPEELRDAKKRKEKLDEVARKLKESGRKMICSSDMDCRVMKTTSGFRPSYNLQAAVDSHSQVIVAGKLTQNEHDAKLLPEMIKETEANTGVRPALALADTGYSDESTLKWLDESGQDALIPLKEHPQEKKRKDLFSSRCFLKVEERDVLVCPAGRELVFQSEHKSGSGTYRQYGVRGCKSCSFYSQCVPGGRGSRRVNLSVVSELRGKMLERLKSEEGRKAYSIRGQTVEPVFGQAKSNRGFNRFLLRGLDGASVESWLAFITHNMLKLQASC